MLPTFVSPAAPLPEKEVGPRPRSMRTAGPRLCSSRPSPASCGGRVWRHEMLATIRQDVAHFQLYRHRSLHVNRLLNTRFAAFKKVYKISLLRFSTLAILLQYFAKHVAENLRKLLISWTAFLLKCWVWSGAKVCKSCRRWKMLQNAYLLAKVGFDTTENEPAQKL